MGTILLTACGSDEKEIMTEGNKVNVAKALEFKVDFADYNAAEEVQTTRTEKIGKDTISKQVINLSNNLLAEVTVQRDTTKTTPQVLTRTLDYDTYTLLAYQGGVCKGELTGTVQSGVFKATHVSPSGDKGLDLQPGTYDFVLYNSKVSRNGDNLTVAQADQQAALIGRVTYNVGYSTSQQRVTFTMKHACARMKVKLTGYQSFTPSAILSSTDIPMQAVYNAATDIWSHGTGTAMSANCTFPKAEVIWNRADCTTTSNEYLYFFPSIDASKLKLTLTGGQLYGFNLNNISLPFTFTPALVMTANASYIVNIKLVYNVLYLMSDGNTGFFKQTTYGGGSMIPIGVVLSQSRRLAIALKDAHNGDNALWCTNPSVDGANSTSTYGYTNPNTSLNDMDGYHYTWEDNGKGYDNVIRKGDNLALFPVFYYAGHYGDELANSGIHVTGSMVGRKWYLASNGEWKYFCSGLGLENLSSLTAGAYISGNVVDNAFTQVGGEAMSNKDYRTSSEGDNGSSSTVFTIYKTAFSCYPNYVKYYNARHFRARAFIKY